MPQLPTIGQQNWGTPLNNFLETAHDNTPTNGGKVKPDGILPGSVGQVLTTGANGPAWASANSLLPTTVFPYNLPGEYKTIDIEVVNHPFTQRLDVYTVPSNKNFWVLHSIFYAAAENGNGANIGAAASSAAGYFFLGQANEGGSNDTKIKNTFLTFSTPILVASGGVISAVRFSGTVDFKIGGWLADV